MRRCVFLVLIGLVGCSSSKAPGPGPSGTGYAVIDGTVAQYIIEDGKIAALVWVDFSGRSHGMGGASGENVSWDGRRVVKWDFVREAAAGPVVKIAGREYPTSAGRVFLVRTAKGQVEVQQLDREPGGDAASIAALAKSDREIQEFALGAKKSAE